MLLRIGRYIIDCPFMGITRCNAGSTLYGDAFFENKDWTPEDCRNCCHVRYFEELKEARLKSEVESDIH